MILSNFKGIKTADLRWCLSSQMNTHSNMWKMQIKLINPFLDQLYKRCHSRILWAWEVDEERLSVSVSSLMPSAHTHTLAHCNAILSECFACVEHLFLVSTGARKCWEVLTQTPCLMSMPLCLMCSCKSVLHYFMWGFPSSPLHLVLKSTWFLFFEINVGRQVPVWTQV